MEAIFIKCLKKYMKWHTKKEETKMEKQAVFYEDDETFTWVDDLDLPF